MVDIKLKNSFYWSLTQTVLTNLVTVLFSIVLARILTPSDFGLISMLSVFFGIGNILISRAFRSSIIRSDFLEVGVLNSMFTINLIVSILVYIILFFSAPWVASYFKQPELKLIIRIISLTFIITALVSIHSALLSKDMNFKKLTLINLPPTIISGIVSIYLAYYGFKVWSLVWGNIINSLVNLFFYYVLTNYKPKIYINWLLIKNHFIFGYKLVISSILDTIFENIYYIIIGHKYNVTYLGYYNRADSMYMYPVNFASGVISQLTYPLLSKRKHDLIKLKIYFKRILKLIVFVITPILLYLMLMADPIFELLFTNKWAKAVPYFQILCIAGIIFPINAYNLQILDILGRSDLILKLQFVKKITFVFVLLLSSKFGIQGLIYGTVINSIFAFIINSYYTYKLVNYKLFEQIKDIIPIFLISFFTYFSCWLLIKFNLIFYGYDLSILISGFIFIFTYILFAKLINHSSLKDVFNLLKFNSNN